MKKEVQKFYSLCPLEWALDKNIKNELGLLLIISSLCARDGYCWATNTYLAKLFDEPEQTISRKLKILELNQYIAIEYKKKGSVIASRTITPLTKMLMAVNKNVNGTVNKNAKENNSNNNIININNKYTSENKLIDFEAYYENLK